MSTSLRILPIAAALLLLASATPRPVRAAEGAARICTEGRISDVFVDNKSIFDVGSPSLDDRFNWAYRLANRMHLRTREEVIRHELLFAPGDCYDRGLLEDSERILRALTFIADADVFGVRQPDGTWHVVVETRDEWSLRLEPETQDGGLSGVELREDNLLGTGQQVSGYVREDYGRRVYGAAVGTRQLLGTQLDAELGVAKTPTGYAVSERLAYPFRGESGRWAFRQQFEHQERYFEYFLPTERGVRGYLFSEERRSFDLGAVVRLGRRGNLTLFGLALAGERTVYPDGGMLVPRDREEDGVAVPPLDTALVGLDSVSNLRLYFLAGQRNVRFDRWRALDAVRGVEDVMLGAEVELGVGRSIGAVSDDDDLAMNLGVLAAGQVGPVLLGGRALVEGKRDFTAPLGSSEWRNVFGQVDGWAYWRPGPESRHTWVAALSATGGWHVDVPYQLTLGSATGVRGLDRHAYVGARRAVVTLEERAYLGWPYPELFDLGTAVFVDAGRLWVGDSPFGDDSPWEVSAGVGLRLAFPPGSRRTYRLDVAVPATGGSLGDVRVSLGIGQAVGRGAAADDYQVRRSARRGVSASLFSFP